MKKNITGKSLNSDVSYAVTWATESLPAKSTTLDDSGVKEILRLLSDYALNTTEGHLTVYMALEQSGSKHIIKLAKRNYLK